MRLRSDTGVWLLIALTFVGYASNFQEGRVYASQVEVLGAVDARMELNVPSAPPTRITVKSREPLVSEIHLRSETHQKNMADARSSTTRTVRQLERRLFDTPLKTSLSLRLAVAATTPESDLRAILKSEFEKARKLRGFKHRGRLDQIFIYVYSTDEIGSALGLNWLAMLSWNAFRGNLNAPTISIKR